MPVYPNQAPSCHYKKKLPLYLYATIKASSGETKPSFLINELIKPTGNIRLVHKPESVAMRVVPGPKNSMRKDLVLIDTDQQPQSNGDSSSLCPTLATWTRANQQNHVKVHAGTDLGLLLPVLVIMDLFDTREQMKQAGSAAG